MPSTLIHHQQIEKPPKKRKKKTQPHRPCAEPTLRLRAFFREITDRRQCCSLCVCLTGRKLFAIKTEYKRSLHFDSHYRGYGRESCGAMVVSGAKRKKLSFFHCSHFSSKQPNKSNEIFPLRTWRGKEKWKLLLFFHWFPSTDYRLMGWEAYGVQREERLIR